MVRGIELDGIKNTPKEYVLLKTLRNEESIRGLEISLLYRSTLLDREDQKAVNDFNKLMTAYLETRNPDLIKERDEKVASMEEQLRTLEDFDMGSLKITTKKGDTLDKTGKIKLI